MDVTMNDGYRWVTVKVPGTPGPEITLMLTPADQIEEGRGSGFAFHSDDCAATHKASQPRITMTTARRC